MEVWGNPSSAHELGRSARQLLQQSRNVVANAVGASPTEIVFTSGGSESDNLALLGTYLKKGKEFKLLTTTVEHSAVRETAKLIEKLGAQVQWVAVKRSGELDWKDFEQKLHQFKPDLVSIMSANNETGVVFPIPEIAAECKKLGIVLHTDAVQAFGKMAPEHWSGADLVSISAHKVCGPKGVGALVIRKGHQLVPIVHGGSQEVKRRGGTENLLGVAGMAGACESLCDCARLAEIGNLRNRFESLLLESLPDIEIQGRNLPRTPNTSHIHFPGIGAEVLLTAFDLDGLCCSAGSACSSGSINPSPVLLAMGFSPEEARQCIRFSWGPTSTREEIERAAEIIVGHIKRIRERRQLKPPRISNLKR